MTGWKPIPLFLQPLSSVFGLIRVVVVIIDIIIVVVIAVFVFIPVPGTIGGPPQQLGAGDGGERGQAETERAGEVPEPGHGPGERMHAVGQRHSQHDQPRPEEQCANKRAERGGSHVGGRRT